MVYTDKNVEVVSNNPSQSQETLLPLQLHDKAGGRGNLTEHPIHFLGGNRSKRIPDNLASKCPMESRLKQI